MKKTYEAPKAEKLEFDYTDTVLTSGAGGSGGPHLTDASTEWWTCETRIEDIKSIDGTVCGYV